VESRVGGWVVCDLEERLEDVPDDVLKVADPRIPRALKQHMYHQRVFYGDKCAGFKISCSGFVI